MTEQPMRIDSGVRPDENTPVDLYAPPTEQDRGPSPLEALAQALQRPVTHKNVELRVPSRPGVTVFYSTELSQEQRKSWQNRATKKSRRPDRPDETDEMLFTCLVLANQCRGIAFGGTAAHDENDEPLTFAMPKLWQMVNATDPQDCIRKLYANDAHVLTSGGEVLLAAGFDDEVQADPTTAS